MIIKKCGEKNMKTITKILIGISILFLLMGLGAAADVNNLKCPDGWESIGGGSYHEKGLSQGEGNGHNLMIMEYDATDSADFFENSTEDSYYVFKNSDNTYNYTDWILNNDEGCFEVVKIDGKEYLLIFSSNIDNDYDKNIYDIMLDFNKLNNLKPIAI